MFHYLAVFERLSDGSTVTQPYNDILELDYFDGREYHLVDIVLYDD